MVHVQLVTMSKQAAKRATRSEGVEWLRRHVCATNNESKSVKFCILHEMLQQHFHPQSISAVEARKMIDESFPLIRSKRCTQSKQTYLFGIELRPSESASGSHTESQDNPVTAMDVTSAAASTSNDPEELRPRIQYLESRIKHLESQLMEAKNHQSLIKEADMVLACGNRSSHGPDSINDLSDFSIDAIVSEFQSYAPSLYALFQQLGHTSRNPSETSLPVEEMKALMALCTLMNARSNRFKGLQLLLSMMLIARATNKQVLKVLNHGGLCLSYDATWKHLLKLTEKAQFPVVVREGHWVWIYDNLNFQKKIRHERSDVHRPDMNNVTSRLAVQIKHIPEGQVDWSDTKPQRSLNDLTIDDLVPNEEDGCVLHGRAVAYVMKILVTFFKCLSSLQNLVAKPRCPYPPSKSEVVPMKILAKDEKYQQANLEILESFKMEANPSAIPQVVVGDQLTCKNIRGVKFWRKPEIRPENTLSWVKEIPGDFHFLWECQRVILNSFWGNPRAVGSLSNLRLQIERLSVDQKGSNFATGDEFLIHVFVGHLTAAICEHFGIESTDDAIQHEPTREWLESTAKNIVSKTILPIECDDHIHALHRSLLHALFLYTDLREAIRYEEGEQVVRQWKFWLIYFLGSSRKNYALEAVTMLSNIYANFPRHIAFIVTHNRFVNTSGKEGHGKPLDMMIEHYNLIIKQAMRSSGANVTQKHLEDVSMCGLFLLEVCKKVDRMFGAECSGAHTTRDAGGDINRIATYLRAEKVTKEVKDREGWDFTNPHTLGYAKVAEGKLDAYLHEEEDNSDDTEQDPQGEMDINYELSDSF